MKHLLILAIVFLSLGCNKSDIVENIKPEMNITLSSDGLNVFLTGSATDSDGTISELMV